MMMMVVQNNIDIHSEYDNVHLHLLLINTSNKKQKKRWY